MTSACKRIVLIFFILEFHGYGREKNIIEFFLNKLFVGRKIVGQLVRGQGKSGGGYGVLLKTL